MSFVMKDLDLVLFLNARIRIRQNCREAVRCYIERRKALYARHCNQAQESATHKKLRHQIGVDKGRNWCGAFQRPLKLKRDLVKDSPWKLSPNRYDVPLETYKEKMGAGGAHWHKMHTHRSSLDRVMERRVRYNVQLKSNNISWLFPGNARDRRPSTRCMINSLNGCYRNPEEPGATHYFPRNDALESLVSPPIKSDPPNPHLFLRASCVPQIISATIPRHISMDPAPGRYEIRYPYFCPCNPKLIYMPGLKLFIDRQKRRRFRRLPYEHIKTRIFCDPEWRHVKGHGFRSLFKMSSRGADLKVKPPTKVKASENVRLKLFHDQRYIGLITEPSRLTISNPTGTMTELPLRIKYNSLTKRVIRKQLRSNKKIAFNSGQERWKDGYRLPPLTVKEQQRNKETLPFERQLKDQPVMRMSVSSVRPKLENIPKHMLPAYLPELRKRLFKFLPLPGAKVLVTEQDTRPEMINGKYQCEKFFARDILPEHFFFDGYEYRRAEEERLKAEMEMKANYEQRLIDYHEDEELLRMSRQSKDEPKVHLIHDEE